jgi:hypothetical protein
MAAVVLAAPMSKTRSWQRYVPTTALIVVKRALGPEHTPTRLRRELDKRLARGGLYAWQVRMVIPALRRDLRDDKIMRSACRACEYLEGLGEAGRSALEASLSGPDHQERQMAAGTLQGQCVKSGSERVRVVRRQPTESLLRATVEGLASDTMDWNAWSSFEFLLLFPEPAKPFVVAGLESSDEQQQILCAALVAHAGHREHYDRAIPILTAHMADNRHCGDARLAGRALHWIGPEATGCLVALVGHGDPQQRAIATLLLRHMNDRPSPVFENELYNFVQTVLGNWPDDFGLSMGDLGWAPERLSGGGEVGRVGLSN